MMAHGTEPGFDVAVGSIFFMMRAAAFGYSTRQDERAKRAGLLFRASRRSYILCSTGGTSARRMHQSGSGWDWLELMPRWTAPGPAMTW